MIRNTSVRRRDGRDINPWCIDQIKNMCSRIINMLGPIKTDSNWLVLEQTASTWIIDSVSRRMGNDNEQASVKSSEFRKLGKVEQGLRRTIEQDNYKKVSLQVFSSKIFDLDDSETRPLYLTAVFLQSKKNLLNWPLICAALDRCWSLWK